MKKFVEVKIDFNKEILFELLLMAHKQDITFNKLCNNIIQEEFKKLKKEIKTK
jgi:hypothetical protein